MKPFWLVMQDDCRNHPYLKRHKTKKSADEEAEKLCKSTGNKYFVLRVLYSVEPKERKEVEVIWTTPDL